MFHYRHNANGSFRGQLRVLTERRPKWSGDRHKSAEAEQERKDPRRDPAFHNRVLFAGSPD